MRRLLCVIELQSEPAFVTFVIAIGIEQRSNACEGLGDAAGGRFGWSRVAQTLPGRVHLFGCSESPSGRPRIPFRLHELVSTLLGKNPTFWGEAFPLIM